MEKLVVNNNVAVVYSPGYGAGWSTWDYDNSEELCTRKEIAEFVLAKDFNSLEKFMNENYPDTYLGGMEDLSIEWVPVGCLFRINVYDGSESVELFSGQNYYKA
jgi:hypothetical protein